MTDEKMSSGQTRGVMHERPYHVDEFHRKHRHLRHHEAAEIVRETKGDRKKADAIAKQRRT